MSISWYTAEFFTFKRRYYDKEESLHICMSTKVEPGHNNAILYFGMNTDIATHMDWSETPGQEMSIQVISIPWFHKYACHK